MYSARLNWQLAFLLVIYFSAEIAFARYRIAAVCCLVCCLEGSRDSSRLSTTAERRHQPH